MTSGITPFLRSTVAGLALTLACATAHAEAPRAVLELFTSQGCSSCPPADELLAAMAKEPDLIAITLPVDYWDYLGWKDTLAQSIFTARQKGYAIERGDGRVYTPQVVVNGLTHAVGSDRAAIEKAVNKSRTKSPDTLSLSVTVTAENAGFTIKVDKTDRATAPGAVWLVPIVRAKNVTITKGENSGRQVAYANVAKAFVRIGDWRNEPSSFSVPATTALQRGADGFVVLVQSDGADGRVGTVLGAARSPSPTQ